MSKSEIRDLLARHAPTHGTAPTPIEGLELIRVTAPFPSVPSIYPASMCFLVDGTKRVYFGGECMTYGDDRFLCCAMPLPVEAEVPRASADAPVLGLLLSMETQAMTETLVATEATGRLELEATESASDDRGLIVADLDATITDAVFRLLQLLDDPCARQVLASARLRELYFALLRSKAGETIRRTFGASRDLGRAFAFLHEHLGEPISVDELARVAGMSKAVFHRRFKAVTTQSPLQFMKAIRLNNAAALIASGMNVAEAADQVGYGSPSQFSREFSRHYGMPPREWANTTNASNAAAA